MHSIPTSRYLIITIFLFSLKLECLFGSSFYFKNFSQSANVELYGDANVINDVGFIKLTDPFVGSVGRVIYKKPFKFYHGVPRKMGSFSSFFEFSISGLGGERSGDGLVFVVFSYGYVFDDNGSFGMLSGGENKFLSVEFDTYMDRKYGDVNGNHVGIDVSSFVSLKVRNLSSVGFGLGNGDRLQVWIDYESGSRRIEVRISKVGENRPVDPLLFEKVDLSKIWPENERFYVGLSSANGNSSQNCNVYSWSFKTREAPNWMHSEPLDPVVYKEREGSEIKSRKNSDCVLRILSALILGVGLGALGSLIGMFLWTIFGNRRPVTPEEYAMKPKHVVDEKAVANEKQ